MKKILSHILFPGQEVQHCPCLLMLVDEHFSWAGPPDPILGVSLRIWHVIDPHGGKKLREACDQQYAAYQHQTGKIVPFMY